MSQLTILIADDEIPYGDNRDFETKRALLENIHGATEQDYTKGRDGMSKACNALREAAFELVEARTIEEALKSMRARKFDAAVLDLGWMGDTDATHPETAGWNLVTELRKTEGNHKTPIIMYSNRFDKDATLARTAVDLETLPLPKTYSDGSHQTLIAAIRFLTSSQPSSMDELFSIAKTAWQKREEELERTSALFRLLIVVIGVVLVAGVVLLLFGWTTGAVIQAASSVLISSFLAFLSNRVKFAVEQTRDAMKKLEEYAKDANEQMASAA